MEIKSKTVLRYTFLALLVIAILAVGIAVLNGTLLPLQLFTQRLTVEQSKSFTDSQNSMLAKYILEYMTLDVKKIEAGDNKEAIARYDAQQTAIIGLMCQEVSTMAPNTIKGNTISWLNAHGVCR